MGPGHIELKKGSPVYFKIILFQKYKDSFYSKYNLEKLNLSLVEHDLKEIESHDYVSVEALFRQYKFWENKIVSF